MSQGISQSINFFEGIFTVLFNIINFSLMFNVFFIEYFKYFEK